MIRISEINISIEHDKESNVLFQAAKRLGIGADCIKSLRIVKKSVDARKKARICFVYTVDIAIDKDENTILTSISDKHVCLAPTALYTPPQCRIVSPRPVVCGMGPAGLFAGLILARAGLRPIIIERGEDVDSRVSAVNAFWSGSALNTQSNVQFGEGGAGAFSDGKLTTNIKDVRCKYVLNEFIAHGAPPEIAYLAKPHIGTDKLRSVVKNLRKTIISLGGEVRFSTQLTNIVHKNNKLTAIEVTHGDQIQEIACDKLITAIGHSARDTFYMMYKSGVSMTAKPFAIGVRIEHAQEWLNSRQYGEFANHPALGAADYKLAAHLPSGRSVYTFCMCPGGFVVASASEESGVVTNGMSYHARGGANANSALLCEVYPSDFGDPWPLAGIKFQQKWEHAAFDQGGGNYSAPAVRVEDFLRGNISNHFGIIKPTYTPGVVFGDLSKCLPDYVIESLKAGISAFDTKLPGFAHPDAVLTGVETRSSSPVRILRTDVLQSHISGVFPCGEGAGYAGGIMSAAVDGIKAAEAVIGCLG